MANGTLKQGRPWQKWANSVTLNLLTINENWSLKINKESSRRSSKEGIGPHRDCLASYDDDINTKLFLDTVEFF